MKHTVEIQNIINKIDPDIIECIVEEGIFIPREECPYALGEDCA